MYRPFPMQLPKHAATANGVVLQFATCYSKPVPASRSDIDRQNAHFDIRLAWADLHIHIYPQISNIAGGLFRTLIPARTNCECPARPPCNLQCRAFGIVSSWAGGQVLMLSNSAASAFVQSMPLDQQKPRGSAKS